MNIELTPSLPGFQRFFAGRGNLSAKEEIRREIERTMSRSLFGFAELFSHILPSRLISNVFKRSNARARVYTGEATFWCFLRQVLNGNCACGEAVRQLQALRVEAGLPAQHPNSKAYCDARAKLDLESLRELAVGSGVKLDDGHAACNLWKSRKVKLLDGTSVSMPDTIENQSEFPQPKQQKCGCGFPVMNLVVLLSLATGAILDWDAGSKSEKSLWHNIMRSLSAGDVLLADSGFFSFLGFVRLMRNGVDAVVRHTRSMHLELCEKSKTVWLGEGDRLVQWRKPKCNSKTASKEEWLSMPAIITLRIIEYTISAPGFRTSKVTLATTLLDSIAYPAEEIASLYFDRWQIELRIRDIKTTMRMDVLHCKTPAMIRKETTMFMLACNLIRALLAEAASASGAKLLRLSFKAAMQQFNQWMGLLLSSARESLGKLRKTLRQFFDALAKSTLPYRPGRCEPRAVKRRPKPHCLLTAPRHQMVIKCHDSGSHKKYAIKYP